MRTKKWTPADVKAAVARLGLTKPAAAKPPPRETVESLTVALPRLLAGLNGKDGLIRQHHHQATKQKDEILAYVKSMRHGTFGKARVKVICTRHYCGTPMDFDNAAASFKYLLDAIVKAGIIADDGPKTIEEWTVRQVRAASRKEQKMEIQIFKL